MMNDNNLIPPLPQSTRSDAAKNRALILATAQRLFAEQGVEAVSMTAIAEAAGVGKGTLYRHFESKGDLSEALLDEDQRDLQVRTFQKLRTEPDPVTNLRWFLREGLLFVERNRELMCVHVSELDSLQHPAHWWWRQTIRGLLAQLHPRLDIEYLTDMLYMMLEVHTVTFQRTVRGYSLERIEDSLLDLLNRILR